MNVIRNGCKNARAPAPCIQTWRSIGGANIHRWVYFFWFWAVFRFLPWPLGITIYHERQNQAYFQQCDDRCEARWPRGRSSQLSTLKKEKIYMPPALENRKHHDLRI